MTVPQDFHVIVEVIYISNVLPHRSHGNLPLRPGDDALIIVGIIRHGSVIIDSELDSAAVGV